jgi:hypothetical protein
VQKDALLDVVDLYWRFHGASSMIWGSDGETSGELAGSGRTARPDTIRKPPVESSICSRLLAVQVSS